MQIIGQSKEFHLYYLIKNDIKDEEKQSGLAHVAEHTMLYPLYKSNSLCRMGYTCNTHICLYFSSNSVDELYRIDEEIMQGKLITYKNVECSKGQVIFEKNYLLADTRRKEELVRFVTDDRVYRFAMGDILQILSVDPGDVLNWFAQKKLRGEIFRFLFCNKDRKMLLEPESYKLEKRVSNCTAVHLEEDKYYDVGEHDGEARLEIYYRLPLLRTKIEAIQKALFEYCVKRIIADVLNVDVSLSDKFFDYDERYILLEIPYDTSTEIKIVVQSIRTVISQITPLEFERFKSDFEGMMYFVLKNDRSALQYINSKKNCIIYDLPEIDENDLYLISEIDFNQFNVSKIVKQSLRIVIR